MNKFLELVEESNPEKDIDALTDAKRSLQRLLMKSKIEAHGKAFEDILRVRLDDGRVVELEVKDVQHPVEDQEGVLDDKEKEALELGREFSKGGQKRIFGKDPEKAVGKAYGDALLKVASKIEDIVR